MLQFELHASGACWLCFRPSLTRLVKT